jgi:hypothetical protein
MPAPLLALALAAAAPQDQVTLDVPVYRNQQFGVSVPRPFPDWVFEPATSRGTTTVIFHPRAASLRDQLWGALVLTTFSRDVPLGQVADQRVLSSWQPALGQSFAILARDSIAVQGLPAIHLVMSGAIEQAVLDVGEYLIARGGDLILLQFRYPRGLPRDSIAAGYQRVLDGLRIVGSPGPPAEAGSAAEAATTAQAAWRALAPSPWQSVAYDALVRFDSLRRRYDVTVRLDVLNVSALPQDSATLWLWPRATLDSARFSGGRSRAVSGSAARIAAPAPIGADDYASIFVHLHVDGASALLPGHWLPLVAPVVDSLGRPLSTASPRRNLRFDLPASYRAVAAGRLASDVESAGRRRMTWVGEGPWFSSPAFVVGRYASRTRRSGSLTVRVWSAAAGDSTSMDSLAARVADYWRFLSRVFGPLPRSDVSVVLGDAEDAPSVPGLVFASRAAAQPHETDPIAREVARAWWGGAMAPYGAGSAWLAESFPAWAALAARAHGVAGGDTTRQRLVREAEMEWRELAAGGDPPLGALAADEPGARALLRTKGVAAVEAARRAAGEARFRTALREILAARRGDFVSLTDVIAALGEDAASVLRPYLGDR